MSEANVPVKPKDAFRIVLKVTSPKPRLDAVLIEEIRKCEHKDLKLISRVKFKELFKKKHIRIKGQPATPSSSLAAGVTYVDIVGYGEVS